MSISIRFIHPETTIYCMKEGIVYNSFENFKTDFNKLIKTEFHLYEIVIRYTFEYGYLLRVLDNNGYFCYESRIYILGDEKEKEECIRFIQDKAILQKIFRKE